MKTGFLILRALIILLLAGNIFFAACTQEKSISAETPESKRKELLSKAAELTENRKFQKAEKLFQRLFSRKADYELFYYWAKLKIAENDISGAITKFRKASMLTRKPEIWLELLEFEAKTANEYFPNDYHKFLEFAKEKEKLKAKNFYRIWEQNNSN